MWWKNISWQEQWKCELYCLNQAYACSIFFYWCRSGFSCFHSQWWPTFPLNFNWLAAFGMCCWLCELKDMHGQESILEGQTIFKSNFCVCMFFYLLSLSKHKKGYGRDLPSKWAFEIHPSVEKEMCFWSVMLLVMDLRCNIITNLQSKKFLFPPFLIVWRQVLM